MIINALILIKNFFKNKTCNSGFTVIELVVGLLIGSILLTSSLAIYQNIAKSTTMIQKITSTDTQAMILKERIQKDLTGISMLWFTPKKYEEMKQKAKAKGTKEQPNNDQEQENNEPKKDATKELAQQENNFFYSNNNPDGTFDTLSFVTTSALQMYGSNNKPLIGVVYFLRKDNKTENSFSLFRKEIDPTELNKESLKNSGTFYELANNIKNCSFEYGFINKITVTNDKEKEDKNKPTEISWIKEWNEKKDETQNKTQKPMAPKFIKIKINFITQTSSNEQEYELCFVNPIDSINPYTSFTQKNFQKEQQSKQQQTQQQPVNNSSEKGNKTKKDDNSIKPGNLAPDIKKGK